MPMPALAVLSDHCFGSDSTLAEAGGDQIQGWPM